MLFLLACAPQAPEIESYGWVVSDPDRDAEAHERYDTGDSGDTDVPAHTVVVSYVPWTDDGEFWIHAGEENSFGYISFISMDSGLVVDAFPFDLYVSEDAENVRDEYALGYEGNLVGNEYVTGCRLANMLDATGGLTAPSPTSTDGRITITDELPLGGEFPAMFEIFCPVADLHPHGSMDGFALNIGDVSGITGYSQVDDGPLEVTIADNNGGPTPTTAGILAYVQQ